ncbi:unnamed protein product, partial [marine sediment metagenome]
MGKNYAEQIQGQGSKVSDDEVSYPDSWLHPNST